MSPRSGTGTADRGTVPPGVGLHAAPRTVVVASAAGAVAHSLDRLTSENADPGIYADVDARFLAADVRRGRREGP
ncbi:hypothetical protein GCM10009696_15790 [Kocuria himachalensis]